MKCHRPRGLAEILIVTITRGQEARRAASVTCELIKY